MASDTELEIVDAFNKVLPRLPSMGIRVGLDDINDLKGLATLLDKKFGVLIKKFGGELEKQTKTQNVNNNKNETLQQTRDEKYEKNAEKRHKELVQSLRKKGDDLTNSWKDKENFYINMLKKTIDGITKVGVEQLEFAQVLVDLNKSGVVLSGGFKSLSGLAFDAGQTSQMFAKNLAKMTPTITKLNGVIGNGAKLYADQYKQLRAYGMAQDDANAAFEYAINQLTPAQLREMEAHNTLTTYIQQTSQQLLKLRDATGKSIETITQENDLKSQSLRVKAWASDPKNKNTYDLLKSMGLNSPEIIDYLLTGIPTSKLTLAMAGNKDIGMLLPMLSQSIKSGQGLTAESVASIQKKLRPYYNQAQNERKYRAQNTNEMAGAMGSEAYEYYRFANLAEDFMKYGFDNIQTNSNDNTFTKNFNTIEDAKNRAQEFAENIMRGGFEGVDNSMKLLSSTADKLNDTLVFMNEKMRDTNNWMNDKFGSTTTGILGTLGAVGLAGFGAYIKDWATMKLMKVGTLIVGSMIGDNGYSGADYYDGSSKNKSKTVYRDKNGRFRKPTKMESVISKSKYLKHLPKVGKGLGAAALLYNAYQGYDLYNNYDNYKEQGIAGEQTGEFAGGLVGGLAGAKIGAMIGAVGGPIGMLVGAGVGSLAGSIAGAWGGGAIGSQFDKPAETGFKESSQSISTSIEQSSQDNNEMKEIMKQSVEETKMTNTLLEDFMRKMYLHNLGVTMATGLINSQ